MKVRTQFVRALAVCVTPVLIAGCSNEAMKRRHMENGERFLARHKFSAAIVEFRNAVARDENWGEARFRLAEAYAANGSPERAFRQYIRAADLMPDNSAAQLKAAAYLLVVGQYEDARSRVKALLERDPTNVEAQIILGNALAGLRDLEGAINQIDEAIALEPGRGLSYTNLGFMRAAQGRATEARAAFEKAVATDPKSIPALLALANFQWSLGEASAVEATLKKALTIDESHVLTNRAFSTFLLSTGRGQEAEPHLKRLASVQAASADAQIALADYYAVHERGADARAVLESLRATSDVRSAAEIRLASIMYMEGAKVEAHKLLGTVLEREPSNSQALVAKARWLLDEGKTEQALVRAQSAAASSPRSIEAHYLKAVAEERTRRSNQAIQSYKQVARLNPTAALAKVQLSRLHLARNDVEAAVLYAEEALQAAPDSLDARLALVRAWNARGDIARATADLNALRKEAPTNAAVHALDGSLRMLSGNKVAAHAAFERALELDPTSMEALIGITTLDVLQKRVPAARARIEARLAAQSQDPELLLLGAKVFIAAGDFTRAEQVLREASAIDPLGTSHYVLLGQLYVQQRKLDAAKSEFDELSKQRRNEIWPRIMAAMIVHTQGHRAEARRRYEEIVKLEPRAALAANNLAAILADAGQNLDYAQRLAESALEVMPADPEVQDTLGWVFYQRQLHPQAVYRFRQSVEVAPENPVYRYHLGLAYAKNGEPELAREALQKALALRPGFAEARTALASLGR